MQLTSIIKANIIRAPPIKDVYNKVLLSKCNESDYTLYASEMLIVFSF